MNKAFITLAALAGAATLGACATLEEEAVDATSDTYRAHLMGSNEVPAGSGDRDGMADAEISVSDATDLVCWEVKNVTNIGPVTAAHIHFGRAGTNGPPVFTLTQSNEGRWQGCKNRSEWTENRLQNNPSDFYVNLHTAEYPNGAIRGQLSQ